MTSPWHGHAQWRVLDTDFGEGQHFFAAWARWLADLHRPRLLHYCAITPHSLGAQALCGDSHTPPLVQELAPHWFGLTPGFHRISLNDGQVLLTLCVGDVRAMLRELAFSADELLLNGLTAENVTTSWDGYTLKSIAQRCRRGTRLDMACVNPVLHDGLRQCGFDLEAGIYNPAWEPKVRQAAAPSMFTSTSPSASANPLLPSQCTVIGAGLAGAAVAASLARRGWQVTVLDAASTPAQGASSLPVGLLATHVSPDDGILSRLSRSGARISLQAAQALLRDGEDWACSGVLEHRVDGSPGLAKSPSAASLDWSCVASAEQLEAAGLPPEAVAVWHHHAGWVKPAALVAAMLAHPNIRWRGDSAVATLRRNAPSDAPDAPNAAWQALDAQGKVLAQAPLLVVTAAYASQTLANTLPLQAVRGQVTLGAHSHDGQSAAAMPLFPVNGHGHLIPCFPEGDTLRWAIGATFERDAVDLALTPQAVAQRHQENLERLQALLPNLHALPQPDQAFVGLRCVSPDRLPLVGAMDAGLWVSTAMGSRGLSLALLCAELLAARLHGEPLPLEARLAKCLDAARFTQTPVR